ncbi:MAG: acylphosphatase [Erysipelotrichaceae bacterium]|jgi:acylphosphatase|nr:acylphosphatase [Erysipelotrichaceae bacterium]
MIRMRFVFYGDVQGVGFRWVSVRHARELCLTGWVRNCYDGSVEMEVQGPHSKVYQLLAMLRQDRFIHIERMQSTRLDLVEDETGFNARY